VAEHLCGVSGGRLLAIVQVMGVEPDLSTAGRARRMLDFEGVRKRLSIVGLRPDVQTGSSGICGDDWYAAAHAPEQVQRLGSIYRLLGPQKASIAFDQDACVHAGGQDVLANTVIEAKEAGGLRFRKAQSGHLLILRTDAAHDVPYRGCRMKSLASRCAGRSTV
jgi:hypothetical protein